MGDRHRRRRCAERGSSLTLMPAAVLVFVVLGAFAVDFAAIHLGQRELVATAQSAANDAAAAGYDSAAFYTEGTVRFDERAAARAARSSLAASGSEYRLRSLTIDDGAITVVVDSQIPTIFAKALPGGPTTVAVDAQASSDLDQ